MVVNCSDITFVFQGPYYSSANSRNSTCLAAESIKHYFPGSPIIFSTWNNPENSQFFDKIILNDDPGPGGKYYLDKRKVPDNINRQIISSRNGMLNVQTPYAVKLRSDIYFTSSNLLSHLRSLEFSNSPYSFCEKKLLTASNLSCNPLIKNTFLYHPCDWLTAGLTRDLQNYYTIDLASEDHFNYHDDNSIDADCQQPLASRFAAEQYILLKNVDKIPYQVSKIENCFDRRISALKDSIKVLVSNFYMLPSWQIGFNCYKYRIHYFTSICNHLTLSEYNHLAAKSKKNYSFRHHSDMSIHRIVNAAVDKYVRPFTNYLKQ